MATTHHGLTKNRRFGYVLASALVLLYMVGRGIEAAIRHKDVVSSLDPAAVVLFAVMIGMALVTKPGPR